MVLYAQVYVQPIVPDDVVLSWTAPDEEFSVDSVNCDMTTSILTTCTIHVTVPRLAPYSLECCDSVFAKVIAQNLYGFYVESLEGNGAFITQN